MPIILEARGSYFNRYVYEDLNIIDNSFPTIEWKGVETQTQLFEYLKHIFNPSHCELIAKNIGLGLHELRLFTDALVYAPEPQPNFYKYLECADPAWDMEYNKFLYKIGQVYLRPEVEFLLDNNTLDFAILDLLYNFIKTSGEIMIQGPIGEEVKQKSILKAFYEVGLVYEEKYYSYITAKFCSLNFFKKYYNQKYSQMSKFQKIDYNWWVFNKGLHIKDLGISRHLYKELEYYDHKPNANWDVDLYGKVGRRDDPGRDNEEFIVKETGGFFLFSYGKFTEFPIIRLLLSPVSLFLNKAMGYPGKFLNLKAKHDAEWNPEPPIANFVHKWIEERATSKSKLPQHGAEIYTEFTKEEHEKALMKIAYIYDHPDMFKKPIKWRYIRRYAREVYKKNSK